MDLQAAVDRLYQTAILARKPTSTRRMDGVAALVIGELKKRGLRGALTDMSVAGGARPKSWDVVWSMDDKPRLVISLKSILTNLGGTVPNRLDDLMGEVTNVQMYSPEVVTGYVMIFNVAEDTFSARHGSTWSELLRSRIETLSGRRPPAWSTGMIEASWFVEVDFSQGPLVVSGEGDADAFFDLLVAEVRRRNPNLERTR